ncbi:hypothetical protein KEM56_001267, partial [Ascosphaera pollenicola]
MSAQRSNRSRSPPRWRNGEDQDRHGSSNRHSYRSPRDGGSRQQQSRREQRTQLNQLQEEERMREWVAQEDDFVLRQAKKKAEIRVKEGRAKPIDWLTVTLRVVDPTRNLLDDEVADSELDFVDPEGVLERLSMQQLTDLETDIDTFLGLEKDSRNIDFWKTMKVICIDRKRKMHDAAPENRVIRSVAADIDRLLGPKSYEELCTLEKQIRKKLDTDEAIDTDYWEQLLQSLLVWKARAKVKKIYESVIQERVSSFHKQQREEADAVREKLALVAPAKLAGVDYTLNQDVKPEIVPEPFLQLRPLDKGLEIIDEEAFLQKI